MKIKLVSFNSRFTHSCLALFYVRNELLRRLGHCQVTICQCTINEPCFDNLLRISEDEPDAVFFSLYVWNQEITAGMARDLAELLPGVRIVFGGPQATYMPKEEIPQGVTVVRGAIEGVPERFYEDLEDNTLRQEYLCGQEGDFAFPYRDEDFDTLLKNRQIYYESSRGCPYACTYCLSSASRGLRVKETAMVLDELRQIIKNRPPSLRFVDRTFNADPDRALSIWRFLEAAGGDTVFHFEIAGDLFTEEMFRFLEQVRPGLFRFEIGIQSTHRQSLEAVKRRTDTEKVKRTISRLVALDTVHIHADLILGLPFETLASYRRSFHEVFALLPHYLQMGHLKVLPGTTLAGEKEFAMVSCRRPPYEITATRWMDHQTIAFLHWFGEVVESFYNNRFFRRLWNYVRNQEKDPFSFFAALLSLCREEDAFPGSKTQGAMTKILRKAAQAREDRGVLLDILRFEWLASGNQVLPEDLGQKEQVLLRKRLKLELPQAIPGLYDHKNRNSFFKHSAFADFSGEALQAMDFGGAGTREILVFRQERTKSVVAARKTVLLKDYVARASSIAESI